MKSILSEQEIVQLMNNSSQGLLYKPLNMNNSDVKAQIELKMDEILKEYPYQQNILDRVKYFTPLKEEDVEFDSISKSNIVDLRIHPHM
jgi:hypothetical protein